VTAHTAGRPRLRELRIEAGWTQQQLADKLAYFAWTRGHKQAAVNADMVAKWERGAKGISPRYRILLCQLFAVTPDKLGVAPAPDTPATPRPARDPESLVSMLDQAAALLTQLGAPGTALAPQMLTAWRDTATSRRTMLGLLDPAATDPAGHARAATATIDDLEQLADRYQTLHATADPAALLTPAAAHIKMTTQALGREHATLDRRRLLRNLARVATLAGRLAFEDLGDALSGRAYYALALDSAREAGDHHAAATALGYTAQLAHAEGHSRSALDHLAAAITYANNAPTVTPWLAAIEATVHADHGNHTAARDALDRAQITAHAAQPATRALPEHSPANVAATVGHAQLRAGDHTQARDTLATALDQLAPTARRTRVEVLLDLATAELHEGNLPAACRHATTAAGLLNRTPYAAGATRLRAFRDTAVGHAGPKVLQVLDEYLSKAAA
jgi:transcriptional regulator with XRE-family HTH domain/tetratricopeptide (TPR) repeat protein